MIDPYWLADLARFWSKVKIPTHSSWREACWEWQCSIVKTKSKRGGDGSGYGRFACDGKMHRAHRWIYQVYLGRRLPKKIPVMHTCDNRPCVNPFHLTHGTQKENVQDAIRKGRR